MSYLAWIAWACLTWCPTTSLARIMGYGQVARAISAATQDPDDASLLAKIGGGETGYDTEAVGDLGEIGVWQLMPPQPCAKRDLPCQAKEALRRAKEQGMCGYTGEDWRGDCPIAREYLAGAAVWVALHPFPGTAPAPIAVR